MGEKPKILHSLYWMLLFFLLPWPQPSWILGKNSWPKRKSPFLGRFHYIKASLVMQTVKNLPAMRETRLQSLCREDPLEKGMTTHSSILAWRIPWTEKPGGLQSIAWQRVGHNWTTWAHTHSCVAESFCCTAEINTALWINCTSVKNKISPMRKNNNAYAYSQRPSQVWIKCSNVGRKRLCLLSFLVRAEL